MFKRYSQILDEVISDRAGEVELEILAHNHTYRKLNDQINGILKRIEPHLPPELHQLVLELDDYYTAQAVLAHEVMYRQGVKDGFNCRRLLKRCAGAERK